jgi:tetratricopeptide (TPR) repeat protein
MPQIQKLSIDTFYAIVEAAHILEAPDTAMSSTSEIPDQATILQQQDLLAAHRERLAILLRQHAQLGTYTPPHIIIDIRETQARLLPIKAWLRAAGVPIADEPNDDLQVSVDSLPSARHQLRAPVGDFVGRTSEITQLIAALHRATDTGGVAAITGVQSMGGIGKTELAYVVAQQVRDAFPDAQIVLPLRGSSATPMLPEQALQSVIRAFTPDSQLPNDLVTLESLYRAQLHTKRVLILADDAHDTAQVRPLLPPSGCALLVTSRLRFTLPGMTTIDLEQLPLLEAIQLLRTIYPSLTEDETAALTQACGYLPLALRISASLLHNTPALTVADYLVQLTDERQRLTSLRDPDDPQLDVAATLTLSYAQLDPSAQAVFRQLGTLVADFATTLALAVARIPDDEDATATLHVLLRRNLVMYDVVRQRWRLHDLVRDAARQRLEAAGEAETVEWRYARVALQIAMQSQEQYQGGGEQTLLGLSLFDTERAHIDAARRWAQRHSESPEGDQLLLDTALATCSFEELRYDWRHESIPQWEATRAAAQRLGDRVKEGYALGYLGSIYHDLGETHTAIIYYEQALAIAHQLGNRLSEHPTAWA